jgi:hypothetical protein
MNSRACVQMDGLVLADLATLNDPVTAFALFMALSPCTHSSQKNINPTDKNPQHTAWLNYSPPRPYFPLPLFLRSQFLSIKIFC